MVSVALAFAAFHDTVTTMSCGRRHDEPDIVADHLDPAGLAVDMRGRAGAATQLDQPSYTQNSRSTITTSTGC